MVVSIRLKDELSFIFLEGSKMIEDENEWIEFCKECRLNEAIKEAGLNMLRSEDGSYWIQVGTNRLLAEIKASN
jgi:hypothetical protein